MRDILILSSSHLDIGTPQQRLYGRVRYQEPDLGGHVNIINLSIGGQTAERTHRTLILNEPDLRTHVPRYDYVLQNSWATVLLCLGGNDFREVSNLSPQDQGKRVASLISDLYKAFLNSLDTNGRCLVLLPPPRAVVGFDKFLKSIHSSLQPVVRRTWLHGPCSSLVRSKCDWRPKQGILRSIWTAKGPKLDVHLSTIGYKKLQDWILAILCGGKPMTLYYSHRR